MPPQHRLLSKFYRLKMGGDLRDFIDSMPVRGVHESQMGDNIYLAQGELRVGQTYYPMGIRVWLKNGKPVAQVRVPKAAILVYSEPFDAFKTAESVRAAAMKAAS